VKAVKKKTLNRRKKNGEGNYRGKVGVGEGWWGDVGECYEGDWRVVIWEKVQVKAGGLNHGRGVYY